MVVTFGLERIEAALVRAAEEPPQPLPLPGPAEVRAPQPRVNAAAPVALPATVDRPHRLADREGSTPLLPHLAPAHDLPTRRYHASSGAVRQS
jgi:hypothetical protein